MTFEFTFIVLLLGHSDSSKSKEIASEIKDLSTEGLESKTKVTILANHN